MAIDFNADQNRMGLALLAAAGPSARPMSFGQRMFMGMGQHDQYLREKEAQEMLRKRQATQELLIAAQMQEMQAQAEQRRAQIAAMQQKAAEEKDLAARQAAFLSGGMGTRTTPQQALAGGGGPTVANAARLNERQPFDIEQAIALFGIDNAQKMAGAGDWGRPEVARVVNGMSGGREVAQQFDKFGRPVGTGMEQYRAPISVNQGNKTTFADPFSLKTLQEFQQFQSPDSVASNATSRRGQDLVDLRSRDANDATRASAGKVEWKQDVNGNWVGLPREVTGPGPVTPVMADIPSKKASQSRNALDIIKEAEGLIDKATGSYFGAGVDQAARVYGGTTEGADATAELRALEGALMMAQPRMEGPQSNIDVALYKQMAAQIGDPTVPRPQKKAALSRIKKLHERYGGATGGATGDFEDLGGGFKLKK